MIPNDGMLLELPTVTNPVKTMASSSFAITFPTGPGSQTWVWPLDNISLCRTLNHNRVWV